MSQGSPLIVRLHSLLTAVRDKAGGKFAGIGVIVTEDPLSLPIVALRPEPQLWEDRSAAELLTEVSNEQNPYHDGFHLLSASLEVVRLSQYFSPPILPHVTFDASLHVGGRYAAALFGSGLPDVIATGVATRTYGVAVFRNGAEVKITP